MKKSHPYRLLLAAFILFGCPSDEEVISIQAWLTRSKASRFPTYADFSYGAHERQVFDIWLTPSNNGELTPLVIYIHGGGFQEGNKNSIEESSIKHFQEAGLSVAAIHYRLSDVGAYPIMMEDAARCLQTIRSHAKEWNLNPDKVACYGGSAGAGISLWLGFHEDLGDPGNDDPITHQSTRIMAVATTNGQSTYDLHKKAIVDVKIKCRLSGIC